MTYRSRPVGITALSFFFVFGTLMSGLAAVMLLFPGSVLDPIWRLNPHAHNGFVTLGSWALLLMATVCLACATAALGLWRRTRWGFWTALAVLSANLAGDTTNAVVAGDWRTLIGLPIGGFLIAYLITQRRIFAG